MTSPFLTEQKAVTPDGLLQLARAKAAPRVAIARAGAALPMDAAKSATDTGIMHPVFTGEADAIRAEAGKLNWDIGAYEIIEASGEDASGQAAALACGDGRADILMKGHLHTDVLMKSALSRNNGLRTGNRLLHIFHISHPSGGKPIILSDAAVNVFPDMDTRKAAITACVDLARKLGTAEPKVALLSATESVLPAVPSSGAARELRDWARATIPNADFSGPLALDLILSSEAAAIKGMADDPVAGDVDIIITPDIVSGNAVFKALVYLSGGCAAGVVMGAKVPILLTSRADPVAARLASVALAGVLSG